MKADATRTGYESKFPVPPGVIYDPESNQYLWQLAGGDIQNGYGPGEYNAGWKAWQAYEEMMLTAKPAAYMLESDLAELADARASGLGMSYRFAFADKVRNGEGNAVALFTRSAESRRPLDSEILFFRVLDTDGSPYSNWTEGSPSRDLVEKVEARGRRMQYAISEPAPDQWNMAMEVAASVPKRKQKLTESQMSQSQISESDLTSLKAEAWTLNAVATEILALRKAT